MAKDFRSGQVRTGQLISSGSKLYVYPASVAPDFDGTLPSGFGAGTDTFLYVSGAIDSKGTTTPGTVVIGGDQVVSGSLFVRDNIEISDTQITGSSPYRIKNIELVPTTDDEAASKFYVDSIVGQISRVEQTVPTGSGDHDYTLTYAPISGSQVIMSVNGVIYKNGVDFGVTGTLVNWVSSKFSLELDDCITFDYHSSS